jgi:hypothetical protein
MTDNRALSRRLGLREVATGRPAKWAEAAAGCLTDDPLTDGRPSTASRPKAGWPPLDWARMQVGG